jgi:hypothetical protein
MDDTVAICFENLRKAIVTEAAKRLASPDADVGLNQQLLSISQQVKQLGITFERLTVEKPA